MRKIEIQLSKEPLLPGEEIEGHILVTCDDDFKCERLYVTLVGEEVAQVVIHAGKVTVVYKEDREHVNEVRELAENLLISLGESRYEFSFTLPTDIPGNYKGRHGWIHYLLEAKAEISWGRDPKSKLEVPVRFNQDQDMELSPQSKSGFIEDEGMTILKSETSRDRIRLGNEIDFRFLIDREVKMRGLRVEIIRCEHVEPKGHKTDSKETLAETYFTEEEIRRDSWIEGSIQTDTNWIESFSSELIDYSHFLKITLDIARRRDKVLEIPILLTRRMNEHVSEFEF